MLKKEVKQQPLITTTGKYVIEAFKYTDEDY
jgi:hypothetical protein